MERFGVGGDHLSVPAKRFGGGLMEGDIVEASGRDLEEVLVVGDDEAADLADTGGRDHLDVRGGVQPVSTATVTV